MVFVWKIEKSFITFVRLFTRLIMERIQISDRTFDLYLREEVLLPEIRRVAQEIRRDLGDRDPLFVCVLNGAFMFATELMKELGGQYEICFAKYSSYQGLCSTGKLTEEVAPQIPLSGRSVVILEDLIDTGFTLSKVIELYKSRGADDVRVAVMLSKPDVPKVTDVKVDYVGLEIPNDFIVGHGLDYNGRGRMLRDIYVVVEE